MDQVAAAERITVVDDALIVPNNRPGLCPGVVDAVGAPVFDGGLWLQDQFLPSRTFAGRRGAAAGRIAGSWLFAGYNLPHFGHFLVESLSRLWAVPLLRDRLDGIVFLKFHDRHPDALGKGGDELFRLLGIDLPVRFVNDLTEVERLHLPRPGSGLGPLAAGTPAFRAFVRRAFDRIEPRRDAERIYISRLGYGLKRGGFLAEERLEARLRDAGYTAFSPERESIADQIATYRGARRIVSADSSALHLYAFASRPGQKVAVIARRKTGLRDVVPQIAGYSGTMPLVIDAISAMYQGSHTHIPTWSRFAELDLGAVGEKLAAHDFIADATGWAAMTDDERDVVLADHSARLKNATFTRLDAPDL